VSEWIAEGVSVRVGFGHPNPVVHLVVISTDQLWCSGGPGRKAAIGAGAGVGGGRPCPRCASLAREAFERGDVDESAVTRFLPDRRAVAGRHDE
jgi:hypothetical protein